MATETIWTALPTGRRRGQRLGLSTHVTPRLTSSNAADADLSTHPAFLPWPPTDLGFEVTIGANVYPPRVVTLTSTPDPDLFAAMFPAKSRVRSHAPVDRSATAVHSYGLTKIVDFLRKRYSEVAINSPEEFQDIETLLSAGFEGIRFNGRDGAERWNTTRNQLLAMLDTNRVVDTTAPSTPTFDFVAMEDFFAPLDGDDPAVSTEYQKEVAAPELDFHSAVQFVNQHPTLMRLLGLCFDLEVDTSDAPIPAGPVLVSVRPRAEALESTTVRRPQTRAQVTATDFVARPRPGTTHLTPGWLRLEDATLFEVVAVDADGGGLKAADFAYNLGSTRAHSTDGTPTTAALPVLRQDGFSVAWKGKAKHLHDTLTPFTTKETALQNGNLELYLDDLVRGILVDVWDQESGRWRSLMKRVGRYELLGGTRVIPVADEGFLGTTTSKKPLADDLYVSEEVFWWDGWSLVVPRPGKVLTTEHNPSDPLIDRPPNDPGPDFDARLRFDIAPGTLPRLRHGERYRFRARLVDLAGNSAPAGSRDASHATPRARFGRFEPPQTPPVLLRKPLGAGETVETVVLRSAGDASPSSPPTAERHLVPPKVGQIAVELHGLIDNPNPDPGTYVDLAALDEATLLNHPAIDNGTGTANRWYDVPKLVPTWAPDPAVRKLAVKLIDGPHAGHLSLLSMGSLASWPNFVSTRLVVTQGSAPPTPGKGVLTVPLPKAEVVRARVSPVIDPAEITIFALWQWVLDALPSGPAGAQLRQALLNRIAAGQHWMFEPFRVLTLVHAVRQPLAPPEFRTMPTISRDPESTFAVLQRLLHFHRKSTGRVDILASWHEPVDSGPGPTPPIPVGEENSLSIERQTAMSFEVKAEGDGLLPDQLEFEGRHEFGDTKHRSVTYRALATTRFAEFFTTTRTLTWGAPDTTVVLDTGTPALGVVPGSLKLTSSTDTGQPITPTEGRQYRFDPATGTITFRAGNGGAFPAVGDKVTAVYLVPPITRETQDPTAGPPDLGPVLLEVPSSARPKAPTIRQVLPTYGWEDDVVTSGSQVVSRTSTRHGNGLRIYLERPWWSSGDGELLGVVLWPSGELSNPPNPEDPDDPSKDADRRRAFITMWGQDPIYGSSLLPSRFPRLAQFPDAVDTDQGLTLGELGSSPALPVNVAGHEVAYDSERDLWFCDLTIASGPAYSPQVRLALVRWQPHSIPNAELSPVVLADVVQLAPDRIATLVFDSGANTVDITLTGPTHTATEASKGTDPGTAVAIVERQLAEVQGPLGWETYGRPHPLTASLAGGVGTWTGTVGLPSPRETGPFRLVVEQYEKLGREPFTKPIVGPITPIVTPRLVHTDIIPL